MYRSVVVSSLVVIAALVGPPSTAFAQSLGTFRWQTQPYCNVLTLAVTQNGGVYTLDGFDDQCGAATKAPVTGSAVANADGTIQFGLTIVASPAGKPTHIAVPVSPATFGGTWEDDAGNAGTFVFTPGAGTGGSARPGQGRIGSAAIDATQVQRRVGAQCAAGGVIQVINEDGSVRCGLGIGRSVGGAADLSHANGLVVGAPSTSGPIPTSGPGRRLMWYPGKAAFRVGEVNGTQWDDANVGAWSVAMGTNVTASGVASVAAGESALALASGAIALGRNVAATGIGSVAVGSNARSDFGAFTFADSSVNAVLASGPNQFNARAVGGVGFYTSANLSSGVELRSGASAWSVLSDVASKENFKDLSGDDVLAKMARMPIREWNYKAQDAAIRHAGPTAQDFHAAFGLGEDPLRISTIDADGIALAGVSALARENAALRAELAAVKADLAAIRDLVVTAPKR